MRVMNNIEYSFLIDELKILNNKHISNIYEYGEFLRFKIEGYDLLVELGKRMNLTKYIETAEEQPSQKILLLRKLLKNAKILSIYQREKDRIVVMETNKGVIVFEMFGRGNIILKNEHILWAYREEEWRDRKIKRGEEYRYPPSRQTTLEDLEDELNEKHVISTLINLNIGIEYAKEILRRAGIAEDYIGNQLKKQEIENIKKEIRKMLEELRPVVFYKEGKAVDFGLTKFSKYTDYECGEKDTLSEAIDDVFAQREEVDVEKEKIKEVLKKQEEQLEQFEKEEKELKEKGDCIYKNFELIKNILDYTKEYSAEDLERMFSNRNIKIDKRKGEIEIDI